MCSKDFSGYRVLAIQWSLPVSVAGHLSLVGRAIEDVAAGGITTLISS